MTSELSLYVSQNGIPQEYEELISIIEHIKRLNQELEGLIQKKYKDLQPVYVEKSANLANQDRCKTTLAFLNLSLSSLTKSLVDIESSIKSVEASLKNENQAATDKINQLSKEFENSKKSLDERKISEQNNVRQIYESNERSLNQNIQSNMSQLQNAGPTTTTTTRYGGWWWWWVEAMSRSRRG